MSRFSGSQVHIAPRREVQAKKRTEAKARQAAVDPRCTKAFRLGSSYDLTTGKRRPWKQADWNAHEESVAAYIKRQESADA